MIAFLNMEKLSILDKWCSLWQCFLIAVASLSLYLKSLLQVTCLSVHTDELLNGAWFCQCRTHNLGSWSLNLNALRSRCDVLRTTFSLISLREVLKMFVSTFLSSNYSFPKYSRDIVISFFCGLVEPHYYYLSSKDWSYVPVLVPMKGDRN